MGQTLLAARRRPPDAAAWRHYSTAGSWPATKRTKMRQVSLETCLCGLPGDQADAPLNLGIEVGQPRLRRVIQQQIALIQGLHGAIVARHDAGKLSDLFGRHLDGRLHHRPQDARGARRGGE